MNEKVRRNPGRVKYKVATARGAAEVVKRDVKRVCKDRVKVT